MHFSHFTFKRFCVFADRNFICEYELNLVTLKEQNNNFNVALSGKENTEQYLKEVSSSRKEEEMEKPLYRNSH